MYYSTYNYQFESKKYGFLIFNGMTCAFAKIEKELFQLLLDIKYDSTNISKLDSDTIATLNRACILVHDNQEEEHIYLKKMSWYNHIFDSQYMGLTIAPTTACNFACPYCFEDGIASKTMSESTIQDLLTFIEEHNPLTGINITWYGGEPLLAVDKIKRIQNEIKNREITVFNQSIITNGYLLTQENQQFIIDSGINMLQITLDGNKTEHDNRRYLKNLKTGTWDQITSNIDSFLSKKHSVAISIRCNVDRENINSFSDLKNNLIQRWHNDERVSVYPGIVSGDGEQYNACNLLNIDEIAQFRLKVAKEKNASIYPGFYSKSCGSMNKNTYVVGPEGELYKCWNEIGRKERIIGYLDQRINPNPELLSRYLAGPSMFDDPKCLKCPLFFNCVGGCTYDRLQNKYNGESRELCAIYKYNLAEYLEQHYAYKLKNQTIEQNVQNS